MAFPICKTIKLGLHKDVLSYSAALEALGVQFNHCYPQFRENEEFQPGEVDLTKVAAHELGLNGTTHLYAEACDAGISRGLELCTLEMGMALRLAHDGRTEKLDEELKVAMRLREYKDTRVHFKYGASFLAIGHRSNTLFFEGCIPASSPVRYPDESHLYRGGRDDEYIFVRPRG
jgi:hypothetical protein